jgi:NTP pyrophosphatase (non-canonical NTP hydrolase)
MPNTSFEELKQQVDAFAADREWERFHTPKNLAMSVAIEAAELMEIFQWLTPEQAADVMNDPQKANDVKGEIADVLLYLVRLSSVLGIDLIEAGLAKVEKNRSRTWNF